MVMVVVVVVMVFIARVHAATFSASVVL